MGNATEPLCEEFQLDKRKTLVSAFISPSNDFSNHRAELYTAANFQGIVYLLSSRLLKGKA